MKIVLGVDTSCYTTSIAAADEKGDIVSFHRRLLPVKKGEKGLRQSEALFAHVRQFPELFSEVMQDIGNASIIALAVSQKPTSDEKSYMPVFLSGYGFARCIADLLRVPLLTTTHQMGHIEAAKIGLEEISFPYYALHLSGGTTDFLYLDENGDISLLGSAFDIHAGQLVDRVGVALGLPFPAGPYLEEIAKGNAATGKYKTSIKDNVCSLSGIEAQALRDVRDNEIKAGFIAAELYDALSRTILKMLHNLCTDRKLPVLITGGVASSLLLRDMLKKRNDKRGHFKLLFGNPAYSGDNAAGVAIIGLKKLKEKGDVCNFKR